MKSGEFMIEKHIKIEYIELSILFFIKRSGGEGFIWRNILN